MFLLQAARRILNRLICTSHFPNNLIVHSTKKIEKLFLCSCGKACKKRIDYIVRIFSFIYKNLLLILTLQFFERQSHQAVTQLVIKPFGILQTLKIVSLSKNKVPDFSKRSVISHLFFRQYLT